MQYSHVRPARLKKLGASNDSRIIFHDLGNMLTALSLSVSHIEEGLVRDTARLQNYSKQSAKTRLQMEYVASLLRDHIDPKAVESFSAAEITEQCIETFAEKARVAGITISHHTEKSVRLTGNKNGFRCVVTNLISNAIEAFEHPAKLSSLNTMSPLNKTQNTHRGKVVRVELGTMLGFVNLIVTDTGCGIRPAHLGKIFDESFTTKPDGRGIGLYAVKQFVEKEFRGKILVKSSTRGTKFLVRIPTHFNPKPTEKAD